MLKQLFVVALLSASIFAHANSRLPNEIYQPARATLLKAKEGRSEINATFNMRSGNVPRFAREVIAHARRHGFRLVHSEIAADEAELAFTYGGREMNVSMDLVEEYVIKYRVELDKK